MMLALGCIQALKCDTNKCPTGVATNDPKLRRGLVVSEKWKRVKNYQEQTMEDFLELLAASGCDSTDQLNRKLIFKKVNNKILSYNELYPDIEEGCYLKK
jgi:glutamate synthase domain-containing protein 2